MKQEAKALHSEIEEFLKIDREELYGEKRLHEISFIDFGKEQFEAIFGLIEDLSKCHFDRVPQDKISSIRDRLQTYKEIFEKAKNLNLQNDSSPRNTRDTIVQKLESNYNEFFSEVSPVISFANQAGTDFKQIEREARQTLDQVKAHSEEQKKQMENKKKSAESILESMRTASAKAGVSQEAIHYSEAQKNHSEKAKKWHNWFNCICGYRWYYLVVSEE